MSRTRIAKAAGACILGLTVGTGAGCESSTPSAGAGDIAGWVCLGPHGTPSAGAEVTAHSSGTAPVTTTAGEDGRFELRGVGAGEVMVVMTNRVRQTAERVELDSGGSATVGADCSFGTGSISVHLCADGSLAPESGTKVSFEYAGIGGSAVAGFERVTNSAGEVSVTDLVPGPYRVTIAGIAEVVRFELSPDDAALFDDPGCYDATQTGSVIGRVCNPVDGEPVSGVPVSLAVTGEPDRKTKTDDDGHFRFDGVPPGDHTVTISPPVQAPTEVEVEVIAGDTTTVPSYCAPQKSGSVSGVVCAAAGGAPVAGVVVTLAAPDEPWRSATTNSGGYFIFEAVPVGDYTLTIPVPGEPARVTEITIAEQVELTIAAPECDAGAFGSVSGCVYNPADQSPVAGVPVELEVTGESAVRATTTDSKGAFAFELVPVGNHTLTVRPPLQTPVVWNDVPVTAGDDTTPAELACGGVVIPDPAALAGVACIGIASAHPVAGAKVTLDLNPGATSTISGLDGAYSLTNLAPGDGEVTITRGGWTTTFPVSLVAGQTLDLGMTHCLGAGRRVAVVTGLYDELATAFADLGLPVRQNETGTIVDPDGIVDLVPGIDSNHWVDVFAAELSTLDAYDLILFNSGLQITRLAETNGCGLPPSNTPSCADLPGTVALENLETFVQGGGHIYVSDWAYEIIRRQFKYFIDFYDNDLIQLRAICGAPQTAEALILDENLGLALGGNPRASIHYEDADWVAINSVGLQRNAYLVPFLVDNIEAYQYEFVTDDDCSTSLVGTIIDAPLLVATPLSENSGLIVFSTFRYLPPGEFQNGAVIHQILLGL